MGEVAGVYGCVINETSSGGLVTVATYFTFGDGKVAFVSDHYKEDEIARCKNAIPIVEDSILLFDIPKQEIKRRKYPQNGTLIKEKNEYIHINEVFFPSCEQFLIYCLVLPHGYYPTNFFLGKPHFAGLKGERIAITWWFREKTIIKVGFRKNPEKTIHYTYVDKPTFSERHPRLKKAYEHAEEFAAKVISNKLTDGGD